MILSTSETIHTHLNEPATLKCYLSGQEKRHLSTGPSGDENKNYQLFWFHNGEIVYRGVKKIKNGLILKKKIRRKDVGVYTCKAFNNGKVFATANSTVKVKPTPSVAGPGKFRGHTRSCDHVDYCINGGTCTFIPKLNRKTCKCKKGFEGLRCEEKLTGQRSKQKFFVFKL
ncbi:hypothetical protein HELRODRAFT_160059 [Helobdella robusta]|uniref:Ig-like domain-containing protein n=1 Tax=Helobdella robusta TaxID=6412 RepID=T1EPQ5_HELRO|nr:hypothetical protein HELRODRAFT_160059 [Helobdella robusta]ESO05960.1 hypothetical protein HELRODRAFT_160059 [Helobdella robusta]